MKKYRVISSEVVIVDQYKIVEAKSKDEALEKAKNSPEGWVSYEDFRYTNRKIKDKVIVEKE